MRHAALLAVTVVAAFSARSLAEEKDGRGVKIEAGKLAPEFILKDQDGKEVKLSSFRGKHNVLIAFYPKDFTGGCTTELKGFRDEHDVFVKADVKVLGVSIDPVDSHKKFCAELKLPFQLLSDEGGKVSKLYGIQVTSPTGEIRSGRSVFLLDREGVVRHLDEKYDLKTPEDHDALLKAVEALKGDKKKSARAAQPGVSALAFGRITVDGKEHTEDVIFDRGAVRERDKKPSRALRDKYGHTPLTPREEIPWDCKTLLIGIGMSGQLPVLEELKDEAKKRGVKLILKKTPDAVEYLREHGDAEDMNVILHITC